MLLSVSNVSFMNVFSVVGYVLDMYLSTSGNQSVNQLTLEFADFEWSELRGRLDLFPQSPTTCPDRNGGNTFSLLSLSLSQGPAPAAARRRSRKAENASRPNSNAPAVSWSKMAAPGSIVVL